MISLDLDNLFLSAPCPNCGYEFEFTFLQVRLQETVICPCCKRNIQLVDEGVSTEIGKRQIDEAMSEFERSLERLNRSLKINL
jgi:uncharacterized Zn finger protein (UPF0148 family)